MGIKLTINGKQQKVCDKLAKDYKKGKLTLTELLLKTTKPKQND